MLNERERAEFDSIVSTLREDESRWKRTPRPVWPAVALGLSMLLMLLGAIMKSTPTGVGAFILAVISAVQLARALEQTFTRNR
jgi:hypothetical protein